MTVYTPGNKTSDPIKIEVLNSYDCRKSDRFILYLGTSGEHFNMLCPKVWMSDYDAFEKKQQ